MADKLSAAYNVSRNSKRWPLTLFMHFQNNTGNFQMKRRSFLKTLAIELFTEHKEMRTTNKRCPRKLQIYKGIGTTYNQGRQGKRQKLSKRCECCSSKRIEKRFVDV